MTPLSVGRKEELIPLLSLPPLSVTNQVIPPIVRSSLDRSSERAERGGAERKKQQLVG
jgi:hypothetical protein